jgi:radical SAM protein with 4Fe4S-binding SPASM domain
MKSRYPRIVIQPVIFRHNEGELPKLEALADDLGLELFIRQGTLGGKENSPPFSKDMKLVRKWLSQNREYNKEYDYLNQKPYLKNIPCYFLWKGITINWDGSVLPCCWVYESKFSFGNIMEQDFTDIWNNEFYRSSRNLFAMKKSSFFKARENLPETICSQCKIFKHILNAQ